VGHGEESATAKTRRKAKTAPNAYCWGFQVSAMVTVYRHLDIKILDGG